MSFESDSEIISKLYSASSLYPGEDGDGFDQQS